MSDKRVSNDEMRLKLQRAQDAELLKLPAFRSFMLRYLRTAGIVDANQSSDPVQSAHVEGRRGLGLEVLRWLVAADDRAMTLLFPTAAEVSALLGTIAGQASNQEEPDDGYAEPFER